MKKLGIVLGSIFFPALLAAQSFELGKVYQCPAGASFKVAACAGPNASDLCDVQSSLNGQNQAGKSSRQQILSLVPLCHLQTPAEATAAARGGSQAPAAQTGIGGFKVGDTVQIDTAFGWMDAKVVRVNGGNSYLVHAQAGADVVKSYPTELRRIGPITAEDRANGL